MEVGIFLLAMVRQASVLAYDGFTSLKVLSLYRSMQNKLLKKVWLACLPIDLLGIGLIVYKANYRFWISETPQSTYLFLARFHYILWPLAIFLGTLFYDWIIEAEEKLQKRHYVFGAVAVSLSTYYLYYFCGQEADPAKPWLMLDSFCFILGNLFLIVSRGSTLIYGLKKLIVGQVEGILKQQTKIVLALMTLPVILLQLIWILRNTKILPVDGFMPELFAFLLVEICLACGAYGFWSLLRLRLFNAFPAVHRACGRDLMVPFTQVIHQIRQATTLRELPIITMNYFEKAFGFTFPEVTLYIRATHHKRNLTAAKAVNTLPRVEELLGAENGPALSEILRKKKILLHAELQYEELHKFDAEAKELRVFLEACNADVFLPVHGEKALVGYIVIERNARVGKLVSDGEAEAMRAYVDHISHVIDHMQKFDAKVVEQECLTYKHQNLQLFQEREHYHEGMRAMMQTQASEAVGVIYAKNNRLHVASTSGAKLLGLPEGTTVVGDSYALPVKQLMHDFKRFKQESAILLKDPQGNLLRFSVMRDARQSNAVVVVSRPTVSEAFRFPAVADVRDRDDWSYAIFLQTTASGQWIEKFIPATRGLLLDFKIKFLRAVLSRQPIFLQGAEEDIQSLAAVAQRICVRAELQEISPQEPEKGREIASQLFGVPAVIAGETYKGALANLSSSGVLLINHVERLSLETQKLLATFFTTGMYTSLCSKQLTSSDTIVLCSSTVDLQALVADGTFSQALYQVLEKNSLALPLVSALSKEQLDDLVDGIIRQITGEFSGVHDETLARNVAEELLRGPLPESVCALHLRVTNFLEQYHRKQSSIAEVSDGSFDDAHAVIKEARRLGKATLRNKKLFSALVALVQSYVRIAEMLGVDYSTVSRTCRRYQIGTFAPGFERKPGRPKTTSALKSLDQKPS